MFPIDLHNADVAGYQTFYFLLIVKALYLIGYNYFQSSIKFRVRLFKVLRFLYMFLIIPMYILWTGIALRQYFLNDFDDFKLNKVYWKVVTLGMVMVVSAIILFVLRPTVNKALKFLKKNDRNEVKYQALFKKTRTVLFMLIAIDIVMLMFLNRVVG
ncbi:MAG: hypothetical protein V4722_25225 [Bacteroidota bacterium]